MNRLPNHPHSPSERCGMAVGVISIVILIALLTVLFGSAVVWAIMHVWQAIL